MLQQLKNQYYFVQVDEILPKINAFKQYYICNQELLSSRTVAAMQLWVTWQAKETSQGSAMFAIHWVDDIVDSS